ncbi:MULTISPECIES: hypothetical protein [unclassified Delftia]|uniref:hypothetical protein n=1 Tax=unclassified Delftia TaxID=2613839 RepID=UPI0019009DDE|nr:MULTISPECIES: hypothetical protein [unclassified Delftia]MBK0115995.1 hypothetical protein [Delftia sp. S65]MBK0118967.1 hypothetical protein [Delftia sp. S67]MBK0133576.1 hypothetical protein [Delftia sp. S66]
MTDQQQYLGSCAAVEGELGAEHFEVYKDHSNVLRTWLTAYGVGAPVLLLSQEKLWEKLGQAGNLRAVAIAFLLGVALQAVLAAINKYVMWSCYYGAVDKKYAESRVFEFSQKVAGYAWIDLLTDAVSIASFVWGTYLCFTSLL